MFIVAVSVASFDMKIPDGVWLYVCATTTRTILVICRTHACMHGEHTPTPCVGAFLALIELSYSASSSTSNAHGEILPRDVKNIKYDS